MRLLKIYLTVVTILLCIALGFGVYVWYTVQKLNSSMSTPQAQQETQTEIVFPVD